MELTNSTRLPLFLQNNAIHLIMIIGMTMTVNAQTMVNGIPTIVFNHQNVAANRILIKFNHPVGKTFINSIQTLADIKNIQPVGGAGTWIIDSTDLSVGQLIQLFKSRSDVVYAEPDQVLYLTQSQSIPNDPLFNQQWAMQNTGQCVGGVCGTPGADIKAPQAWSIATGNKNIVIGDIDTGVDWENTSDLDGNLWQAPSAFSLNIGGTIYNCQNNDYGFNAIAGEMGCNSNTMMEDTYGHGTNTAGIIGAIGNNNIGVTGVNWNVNIIPLKAGNGRSFDSNMIDAIEAAVQIKIHFGAQANIVALNMSYACSGFDHDGDNDCSPNQSEIDEMDRAAQYGIISVAATGDDCQPFAEYPAGYYLPDEIAVAASDQYDQVAVWNSTECSCAGGNIAAPGKNIEDTNLGGGYDLFAGTSASAPFVTGAVALVDSACALPEDNAITDIIDSADHIPALNSITQGTGNRLNLYSAVYACTVGTPGTATVTINGLNCGYCQGNPQYGILNLTVGKTFTYIIGFNASSSTPDQLASTLATSINNDPTAPIIASTNGNVIALNSRAKGPYTNFAITSTTKNECVPPPHGHCTDGFDIANTSFTAGQN